MFRKKNKKTRELKKIIENKKTTKNSEKNKK